VKPSCIQAGCLRQGCPIPRAIHCGEPGAPLESGDAHRIAEQIYEAPPAIWTSPGFLARVWLCHDILAQRHALRHLGRPADAIAKRAVSIQGQPVRTHAVDRRPTRWPSSFATGSKRCVREETAPIEDRRNDDPLSFHQLDPRLRQECRRDSRPVTAFSAPDQSEKMSPCVQGGRCVAFRIRASATDSHTPMSMRWGRDNRSVGGLKRIKKRNARPLPPGMRLPDIMVWSSRAKLQPRALPVTDSGLAADLRFCRKERVVRRLPGNSTAEGASNLTVGARRPSPTLDAGVRAYARCSISTNRTNRIPQATVVRPNQVRLRGAIMPGKTGLWQTPLPLPSN